MKAAVYLRVSTSDQDPDSQGREILDFVASRQWDLVETYQDVGVSGAKARRPALDRLLKDAWHGKFQAVVVWDISRLARSTLDALELLKKFQDLEIRFIAVKQTFDTDSPLGKAFFTLAAMFAELERSILIERVRAGMARAKAEGKRIGRPVREVDAQAISKLRAQGHTIRAIARQLGVPRTTVLNRLKEQACTT